MRTVTSKDGTTIAFDQSGKGPALIFITGAACFRSFKPVLKVVMYDASYVHDETEKTEYHHLSQRVHKLLEEGKNGEAMSSFLKGIGIPKIFVFFMRLSSNWRTMVALAPTLAYDIALTSDVPPLERASRITVPTQIIFGEKSPVSIRDVAAQLHKAIPHARYNELAGQDHLVDAKKLLPLFLDFLKQ